MAKRTLPYRDGDWFAVPLEGGGYAPGVVARADKKGCVVAYFFGPRRSELPTADELEALSPRDAVQAGMFSDLGLVEGRWPLVYRPEKWEPHVWQMPVFARHYNKSTAYRVEYDDASLEVIREVRCPPEEVAGLPRDGCSGHIAIELELSRLLSNVTR